ncbi:MAG: amino acid ABC transporter substrate-binding protein [Marinibacterium sp.]|nr:amino acid ABC transporter substrate-binding protein [Marinibacterium sp.]
MIRYVLPALALLAAGTAGAQTLERIAERNEIRMGYRTDAVPLSYQNADGNPAGYTPVLCVEAAQRVVNLLEIEGLDVSFVPVTAENRFDMVASGEIDLLCGAATITLERREIVDFSIPVFADGMAVVLPAGAATDLQAFAGQTLGVRAGTTSETALAELLERTGVEADIRAFDDHGAGFDALGAGELAAYFGDQSILLYQNAQRNDGRDFRVMDRLLTVETQGLAMARGDSEFRLLIDEVLSGLIANGTAAAIFGQTLPGATPGAALQAVFLVSPLQP